jgi:hypothetical protein
LESEVRPGALAQTEILLVTPHADKTVQPIRGARRHAYRAFSQILMQEGESDAAERIEEHRAGLAVSMPLLSRRIAEYFAVYDGFLGRAAPVPP